MKDYTILETNTELNHPTGIVKLKLEKEGLIVYRYKKVDEKAILVKDYYEWDYNTQCFNHLDDIDNCWWNYNGLFYGV